MILRPRYEGKSIARVYLVAQTAAKNLVNGDKNVSIIYKEKDKIDVLKNLVELTLTTIYGYALKDAKALVGEKLKFQLDDSNATRYNSSINSRREVFRDEADNIFLDMLINKGNK